MKKLFLILLAVLVIFAGFFLYNQKSAISPDSSAPEANPPEITISQEDISEENFSGSRPVISGKGLLAKEARAFIDRQIAEFKSQADAEVPQMRADFGADSPVANYTIDLRAERVLGLKTDSLVVTSYVYTGGAHGSSFYKTFTADKNTGRLMGLQDVIKADQRALFSALVREKLFAYRPDPSINEPIVFEEEVNRLTFENFQNWALDSENLILYFSQYEVGPGVLGSFALPIPLAEIAGMLL